MNTALTLTLAVLLAGTAMIPNVAADDDPPQCIIACDCTLGTLGCIAENAYAEAKRIVKENDPRDWPCTCDPMPNPFEP